jgi:hypothetical protein
MSDIAILYLLWYKPPLDLVIKMRPLPFPNKKYISQYQIENWSDNKHEKIMASGYWKNKINTPSIYEGIIMAECRGLCF